MKVLDRYTMEEKKELFYGWEMKDLSIDRFLFPHTLYVEEDKVEAYAIHHLKNSEILYDYYQDYSFFNFDQMLHSFKDASLILRRVHENKIVGGDINFDINFDNILINQNGFLQYIDVFDSCHFGSFCSANFVSLALYNFMTLYRGGLLLLISMKIQIKFLFYLLFVV